MIQIYYRNRISKLRMNKFNMATTFFFAQVCSGENFLSDYWVAQVAQSTWWFEDKFQVLQECWCCVLNEVSERLTCRAAEVRSQSMLTLAHKRVTWRLMKHLTVTLLKIYFGKIMSLCVQLENPFSKEKDLKFIQKPQSNFICKTITAFVGQGKIQPQSAILLWSYNLQA